MTRRLPVHHSGRAERSLLAILRYLDAEAPPAHAERLVAEFERTVRLLSSFPEMGQLLGADAPPGVRRIPLSRLPVYVILFRERDGRLEVLDFYHAARNPDRPGG